MKLTTRGLCIAAMLWAGAVMAEGAGGETAAEETYDLLFRTGTLDALPRGETLVYDREVVNAILPETATRDTGEIELSFAGGSPEVVALRFLQEGRHKSLGDFPASVGNPIILYFVETIVRDMAETAGGSPFYIRNRVKAALVEPAEVEPRKLAVGAATVPARAITLRPFEGDAAADRMRGFDALEITVTVSDAVPGWYGSLAARVPGSDDAPLYASVLTLEGVE